MWFIQAFAIGFVFFVGLIVYQFVNWRDTLQFIANGPWWFWVLCGLFAVSGFMSTFKGGHSEE